MATLLSLDKNVYTYYPCAELRTGIVSMNVVADHWRNLAQCCGGERGEGLFVNGQF